MNVFQVRCDRKNFAILKMVMVEPTSIKEIRRKFKLTPMPANRRINKLVEVGLLKREDKKTKIRRTTITPLFIKIIKSIQTTIEKEIEIKKVVGFK